MNFARLKGCRAASGEPFFVWVNFTHMHLRTHTKPASIGQAGRWQSPYHDTMIDHDKNVGEILQALDDLGIADNTFVMYSTDNGPHMSGLARCGRAAACGGRQLGCSIHLAEESSQG
jgi:arylsulfatase A-like enzyme